MRECLAWEQWTERLMMPVFFAGVRCPGGVRDASVWQGE